MCIIILTRPENVHTIILSCNSNIIGVIHTNNNIMIINALNAIAMEW